MFDYANGTQSHKDLMETFEQALQSSADPNSDMRVENPEFIRTQLAAIRPGNYRHIVADWGSPCDLNGFYMIVDGDRMLSYYPGRYAFFATLFKRVR